MATDIHARFVNVDGVRTRVLHAGQGPAVILLHGVGLSADTFIRNLAALGERYSVYAPDMPGHGFTDAMDFAGASPQLRIAHHMSLLADSLGLASYSIGGSSFGALVAALMWFERPERICDLILIGSGSAFHPADEQERTLRAASANAQQVFVHPSLAACRRRLEAICFDPASVADEILLTQVTSYALTDRFDAYRRTIEGVIASLPVPENRVLSRLEQIRARTLILTGREDVRSQWALHLDARKRIPNSRFVLIERCGHLPYMEHPAMFNEIVGSRGGRVSRVRSLQIREMTMNALRDNALTDIRIAPRRLGHLNVFVRDVEASAAFYRDVCGFKEVFREPGISMIFMSNGNTHHDLGLMEITDHQRIGRDGHVQVAPGHGKTPGLNHLGWEMETEAELVAAYRRAKKTNMRISRTTDHQIAHSMYISDVNGHTLEFYADVVDDWREVYAQNVGELITGNWDPEAAEPLREPKNAFERDLHRSTESPLASRKIAHAGLPVKSLADSLRYYTDVIGLRVVSIDEASKFAVLTGTVAGGCDLCLMERPSFPKVRLLFGGVQLHDGQPVEDALALLRRRGIPAVAVGDRDAAALVVVDPDGIPLVYSTASASQLMTGFGPKVVAEIDRLTDAA